MSDEVFELPVDRILIGGIEIRTTPTSTEAVTIKDMESQISLREKAARFLFLAYGALLASTIVIYFLQGFQLFGFHLEQATLNWLGGATIGEVGGLAMTVYGFLFRKKSVVGGSD